MSNLRVIEKEGKRVLTTVQLANSYETTERRISENFNSNKGRYMAGKHFYLLEGEDLRQFKSEYGNSVIASNVNKLYLWTERAKCKLNVRLKNLQARAALNGIQPSRVKQFNNLDVIANDVKLKEIYISIIKEIAIKHGVSV